MEQLLPFIAVDHLLKQIDSNSKTVNVFKTVHDIIQQDSRLIVTLVYVDLL